jgi:hypothetical protein
VGGVLGNRTSECLSGTRLGSTQHPLYFLRKHSRASFWAAKLHENKPLYLGKLFSSKFNLMESVAKDERQNRLVMLNATGN